MEIRTNNFIHFGISKQHQKAARHQVRKFGTTIPNDVMLGQIINDYTTRKNRTYINTRIQEFHPFLNDKPEHIRTIRKDTYKAARSYGPSETGDGFFWIFKYILVKGKNLHITRNQYKRYVEQQMNTPQNNGLTRRVEAELKKFGLENYIIKNVNKFIK